MKKTSWNKSTLFLFLIGMALIIAALAMLIPNLFDYKKSNDVYKELNEEFVSENTESVITTEEDDAWWYRDVDIDFENLQELNSDIIGWIRFDNIEQLSYPVLFSGDDETYLRTDIYGNSTIAGCIFMEGMNQPDFNDYHTILYGHNMKNLSMFGSLKKYKTEDFYEGHQFFTIYTADMAYRYQIFSYRDVPETDDIYTVGFAPDETFQKLIDIMVQKSYYDTGVDVTKDDHIITLSTCSTTGKRFVVHAVRIREHVLEK